jgi:hypothetical protein
MSTVTRALADLELDLVDVDDQIDALWTEVGGQDQGVVTWNGWIATEFDRLFDLRADLEARRRGLLAQAIAAECPACGRAA